MAKNKKNRDNNTASKLAVTSAVIGLLSSLIGLITKLIEMLNEQLNGEWETTPAPHTVILPNCKAIVNYKYGA